jgi:hypothetical protein
MAMPTERRAAAAAASFEPAAFDTFRFLARELDASGRVTLSYGLDDTITFVEEFDLPVVRALAPAERERVDGLLALLHWVAGVSYYKTAAPPRVSCESGEPAPATAELLEALYSEGLGEFAFTNGLNALPRPRFPRGAAPATPRELEPERLQRVLIPVGGGKDSAVAIEILRRTDAELALFSIGDAAPIARTVAAAGLPWLLVRRRLDPGLGQLNRTGALNGHVPVTAIVSCVALLVAALHGFDAVAMANERSASSGNVRWDGIEVNHQFSKSLRAEALLRAAAAAAVAEMPTHAAPEIFSLLRPASELAIARAFARLDRYHGAFTSCNAIFRTGWVGANPRAASWCCNCPKCRFVFLVLAPFSEPAHLREVFGVDLLADAAQYEGFALLTATGGHKPFECVGEEQESLAAIRLLAVDPRWREHVIVRRLVAEVLPSHPEDAGAALALGDEGFVPAALMPEVRALLGA